MWCMNWVHMRGLFEHGCTKYKYDDINIPLFPFTDFGGAGGATHNGANCGQASFVAAVRSGELFLETRSVHWQCSHRRCSVGHELGDVRGLYEHGCTKNNYDDTNVPLMPFTDVAGTGGAMHDRANCGQASFVAAVRSGELFPATRCVHW